MNTNLIIQSPASSEDSRGLYQRRVSYRELREPSALLEKGRYETDQISGTDPSMDGKLLLSTSPTILLQIVRMRKRFEKLRVKRLRKKKVETGSSQQSVPGLTSLK